MDAFGTIPLDGMALSGQDPLMGSVWNSAAALDSNAGLIGVLNAMQSSASRGAFTPNLEEPLPTVTAHSEHDSATKLFSRSTPTNKWNNSLLTQDPLTGIAEGAAIAGSDNSDFLTGDVTSVKGEAVLDLAVATAQEQLESFATDEAFLDKMNLAFGEDWRSQEAAALIQHLASGEAMPKIEVLPAAELKATGAFGEDTIYLSEEFLSENIINTEAVAGVLLEEIGHYVDQELNSIDSLGDEGEIFARLVQDETIGETELEALKAEDDSGTIFLNGEEITVELMHRIDIISREEWGAQDPVFSASDIPAAILEGVEVEGRYDPLTNPNGYAPYSELRPGESLDSILDTVVIHHSGNQSPPTVREVQLEHIYEEGYADIGYHYAVDTDGNVFEGRPIDVRGAHVESANTGAVGIVLLGDYEPGPWWDIFDSSDDQPPPQAQVDSVKELILQVDDLFGIGEVLPHTDVVAGTECPGDGVLPLIPEFDALV